MTRAAIEGSVDGAGRKAAVPADAVLVKAGGDAVPFDATNPATATTVKGAPDDVRIVSKPVIAMAAVVRT
jgi:hypothetical protein